MTASRRVRAHAALAIALLFGAGLGAGTASADSTSLRRLYLEAGSSTFPYDVQPSYAQVGLRTSSLNTRAPSIDFALAAWIVPAALLVGDLDLAWPIPVGPGVRVIPRAGVSGLAVAAGSLGGALPAVNAGVGVVLSPEGPISFRADYVNRSFATPDQVIMQTISVGLSWGGGR